MVEGNGGPLCWAAPVYLTGRADDKETQRTDYLSNPRKDYYREGQEDRGEGKVMEKTGESG